MPGVVGLGAVHQGDQLTALLGGRRHLRGSGNEFKRVGRDRRDRQVLAEGRRATGEEEKKERQRSHSSLRRLSG